MPEEDGFEIAAAYAQISPDVADFPDRLDEELAGLVVTVPVVPDASDFAQAVDEQVGGMSAEIAVRAETSEARGEVRDLVDEINSASSTLSVGLDAGSARTQAEDLASEMSSITGTLSVDLDPARVRGQAEALAEELSGITGSIQVGADTGTSSADVEQLAGGLSQLHDAAGTAGTALSAAQGDIHGVEAAADSAAGAVHGLTGAFAAAALAGPGMLGAGLGEVPVTLVPDMGTFDSALAAASEGAEVFVRVRPDTGDFAQAVDEEAGGTTLTVRVVPDTSALQDVADEGLGGQAAGIGDLASGAVADLHEVEAAAAAAGAAVDEALSGAGARAADIAGSNAMTQRAASLNGLAVSAHDAAEGIEEDFSAAEGRIAGLSDSLAGLDAQFLRAANAEYGPFTDAELADMTSMFENLYGELESAQAELAGLRGELSAAGGEFDGMDAGLGSVNASLGEFEGSLAQTRAALSLAAGDFYDQEEAASRLGVSLDDLAAKQDAVFSVYSAGRDKADASLAALNGEAGAISVMGTEAAGTEEAVGGLSGALGGLAGRLSYMAVDPFMWMMLAVPAFEALTKAAADLTATSDPLISKMNQEAAAAGYSAQAWDKVAETQRQAAAGGGLIGALMEETAQSTTAAAANLGSNLGELANRYDITGNQAVALAKAAGVTSTQLAGSGDAANQAMSKVEAYANANITAAGSVSELSGDMGTFSNDTLTATSRVSALDDAYNLLVGNFLSSDEARLTVEQSFLTLASNAKQAGASMTGTNAASVTLQQSFDSTVSAVEQAANAMVQEGDSSQQVTTYIGQQITKLAGLTGGSATAQAAVEQLKQWEDQLTTSTQAQTQAAEKAADTLASQFTAQVRQAGDTSHATSGLVNDLKTSILDTGTTSQQTAGMRQELIRDLENAGLKASTATGDVDGFIAKIAAIPKSTSWSLTEKASGTWSVSELMNSGVANIAALPGAQKVDTGAATVPGLAGGGMVHGGSGRSGADDIPALLSNREYVMPTAAVDRYGVGMMDDIRAMRFAAGGLADSSYSGSASGLGSWTQNEYDSTVNGLARMLTGDVAGAASSAASAASAGGGALHPSGSGSSVQALMQSMAASVGWTGAEWDALNNVEMAEAGYNLAARNPGSGAYGLAQFIQGPAGYAAYGGNSNTASGQITAMLNYIRQRYGDPEAAWAHEQQFHWYANGGTLNAGQSAVVGDGGQPEIVTAGRSGATVTPMSGGGNTVNIYFTGMTYPSAEQIANLKSEMAYALVGAP